MILGRAEILAELAAGRLKIDPFDENAVGPASIELTLKPEFGHFKIEGRIAEPDRTLDADIVWRPVRPDQGPLVPCWPEPGCHLVGRTREKVSLADNLCGWVTPKARTAVFGCSLSITSGFIQPGTKDEELFFLITNAGRLPLHLRPDIRICQLILSRVG